MQDTIVTPTQGENETAPNVQAPELCPAFKRALDKVRDVARTFASKGESPEISALITARDALVGDHPAIAGARAAMTVEIENATNAGRADALRSLADAYKDDIVALVSFLNVTQPNVARPASKRGDVPVARSEAEIDANPEVTRIGAPIDAIDAIEADGHVCPITEALRKGLNVKSALTKITNPVFESGDAMQHQPCMMLAGQVSKMFGHRYALKVKLGLIRKDQE